MTTNETKTVARNWSIGDLITRSADGGENICIGFTEGECIWMTDKGKVYYANRANQYQYKKTLEFSYKFTTNEQAVRDFRSGTFNVYFSLKTKVKRITSIGL